MRSRAGLARRLKELSGMVFLAWLLASSGVSAQISLAEQVLDSGVQYSEADETGRHVYLIRFHEPGLLAQARELRSAEAPSTKAAALRPLKMGAPLMQERLASLQATQAQHIADIGWTLGRSAEVTHHFTVSHSGIALRLTPEEARELAQQPNVASIERERVYQLDTFRGPEFIGAGAIWDGSALPSGPPGLRGAGMVVAVLDSAVDVTSPSFANDPACGHPPLSG